jgi:hypothetical protein
MHRLTRYALTGLTLALTTVPSAPLLAQASPPPAATQPAQPAANPADVGSLDAILAALYDVISGPAGQQRNWDRMRSLFIPGARLIPSTPAPDGKVVPRVLDVEGYIGRAGPTLEKNGFFEREISRKTDTFGSVTQVFSTYESRRTKEDATPFARGINSIQLVNDGTRWWVVTIFWDQERPNNPIPAKYLTK